MGDSIGLSNITCDNGLPKLPVSGKLNSEDYFNKL